MGHEFQTPPVINYLKRKNLISLGEHWDRIKCGSVVYFFMFRLSDYSEEISSLQKPFSTDTSLFLVTADGNDSAWCAVLHHKGHLPNCDKWILITYSVRDLISLSMQECRDVTDMMTFATKTKARLIARLFDTEVRGDSSVGDSCWPHLPDDNFHMLMQMLMLTIATVWLGVRKLTGDTNMLLSILVCSYKKGIKNLSQTLKGNYMYLCILQCECVSKC